MIFFFFWLRFSRFTLATFSVFILGPVVALTERPDPPADLEMTDQTERGVRLTWTPGDEHNSPTQSREIFCYFNFPENISILESSSFF